MGNLKTEVMGRIATLLGFDGTDFHAIRTTDAGRIETHLKSTDLDIGTAVVDGDGNLQVIVKKTDLDIGTAVVDGDGNLQVDVAATSLDLGVARFAYGTPLRLRYRTLTPGAVDFTLDGPSCPVGFVYVLTRIVAMNEEGTTARIDLRIWDTSLLYYIQTLISAVAWQSCISDSIVILKANDLLSAVFTTLQATTNNVALYVYGFQVPAA